MTKVMIINGVWTAMVCGMIAAALALSSGEPGTAASGFSQVASITTN